MRDYVTGCQLKGTNDSNENQDELFSSMKRAVFTFPSKRDNIMVLLG
jgi:hypothetical protein